MCIRDSACYALLVLVSRGTVPADWNDALETLLTRLCHGDHDRYVTAYATEILCRMGHRSDQAFGQEGYEYPLEVRWCIKGDGWAARAHQVPGEVHFKTAPQKSGKKAPKDGAGKKKSRGTRDRRRNQTHGA
eukprot:TRINITY_DN7380_c0_g1_i7.p1 TRINITY_DN7380_c0_g1~~TRINITY_DN7380_c0_g1_i7.p1  ORF type:complete len:132 (+),score=18.11 TRINITY_DN7380_c0_g1_i7:99-494(+)